MLVKDGISDVAGIALPFDGGQLKAFIDGIAERQLTASHLLAMRFAAALARGFGVRNAPLLCPFSAPAWSSTCSPFASAGATVRARIPS